MSITMFQGSILGPLMFLLFINDLPLYTEPINTDLYADDTTLFDIGISGLPIESNLQIALNSLSKWCKENGMVINTGKTKLMLITIHQKRAAMNTDILFLNLNNQNLNTIKNDKILGVVVDNNLSWSSHIDNICKKIKTNLWLDNIKHLCLGKGWRHKNLVYTLWRWNIMQINDIHEFTTPTNLQLPAI